MVEVEVPRRMIGFFIRDWAACGTACVRSYFFGRRVFVVTCPSPLEDARGGNNFSSSIHVALR